MKVFLLHSECLYNSSATSGIECVCDSLAKARSSLADSINMDLQYNMYEHSSCDGPKKLDDYDMAALAKMFPDDPAFEFEVNHVRLWNGDTDFASESTDWQDYLIEEREVL